MRRKPVPRAVSPVVAVGPAALAEDISLEPVDDPSWLVQVSGFDTLREREFESWFTIANGRSGTRGSLEEGSGESTPATYVAGIFGRRVDEPAAAELVPGPEWTHLVPRAAGQPIDPAREEILEHRRILDLSQGVLFRIWRRRLASGTEVAFRSARFASLSDRCLLVLVAEVRADPLRPALADGIPPPQPEGPLEVTEANRTGNRLCVKVRGRGGGEAFFAFSSEEQDGRTTRIGAVARDDGGSSAEKEAVEGLTRAHATGLGRIIDEHRSAWRERWRDADVVIEGDPTIQQAMRFSLFHLISAGDPDSDIASIGARGLTGPGYKGHVFWDTDVFVVPFFISTHPPTARALLAYRYRTLPAARTRAATLGFRGALYAWESADTGEDATPEYGIAPDGSRIPILTGAQEHHISADVAWAVWRYWQHTGDDEFLALMGAEIIIETARFWTSRARWGRDRRYHIARVIGPDEYHEGVRENAFTNAMARWNLERAGDVVALLRKRDPVSWRDLARRLRLGARELARWRRVAKGLADGFDPQTLLYEQFEGFFGLQDIRAEGLARRPFAADVVLSRDRIVASQIVKQADVLMLAHMLPELVSRDAEAENYRYYEPRTSHGSSLSPAIHAAAAARVGLLDDAVRYLRMAAEIDLDGPIGNAALGLHMATMGGMWQATVMGFGGVRPDADAIRIDPRLPSTWSRLSFPLLWHGTRLGLDVTSDRLSLSLDAAAMVALGNRRASRLPAGRHEFRRGMSGWRSLKKPEEKS